MNIDLFACMDPRAYIRLITSTTSTTVPPIPACTDTE